MVRHLKATFGLLPLSLYLINRLIGCLVDPASNAPLGLILAQLTTMQYQINNFQTAVTQQKDSLLAVRGLLTGILNRSRVLLPPSLTFEITRSCSPFLF